MSFASHLSGGSVIPRMVIALFVLEVALIGHSAKATIIQVPEDHPTIQAALNASNTGDTVRVAPGTYFEHLVTPIWSVTMLSDYAWTGDSLDIERTIVDGSWTGSVLSVESWLTGHFLLEGFTLQRGMGSVGGGNTEARAGGVNFRAWANATLRHVVFKAHRGPSGHVRILYGIYVPGFRGQLELDDIRFELDTLLAGSEREPDQVSVHGWRSIQARKLRFKQVANPGTLLSFYGDSVTVSDIIIDRQNYQSSIANEAMFCIGEQYLSADSVQIQNASFCETPIELITNENGLMRVNHLRLENLDLQLPESYMYASHGLVHMSGGDVKVENWTQRNCTTNVGYCVGDVGGRYGVIRNLLAENLVAGTPLSPQADCEGNCTGGGLFVAGLSLDHVIFRNVTLNPFDTHPPAYATTSESIIRAAQLSSQTTDTLFFRNVDVSHTVINDPDDYSLPETDCVASLGRAFRFQTGAAGRPITVIMDSCRFVENRQPNTQPERVPQNPNPGGTRMVGSTVRFEGAPLEDTRLFLRNTIFMHNDDGGLDAVQFQHVDVENVILVDNGRMGVIIGAQDTVNVNNLYISQTNSYLTDLTYPYSVDYPSYQCVAYINGINKTDVRNVVYDDNHTEFLFWCSREDFQEITFYRNSVFSNNSFDFLTNPWYNTSQFPPPVFNYCLLPIEQPGIGNIVRQDAGFDSILGPPFLDAASPCIDAGDPDPVYNDVVDPTNPSFPRWPALGNLRNDMGFTGGPHAVALDTTWTALPDWQSNLQPNGITLGAPYPNPFNPLTLIPYELARPQHVRLSVHNLLGQEVVVLVDDLMPAGQHQAQWGTRHLASGLYLVTLEAGGRQETQTITLLH